MPASLMDRLPQMTLGIEAMKLPLRNLCEITDTGIRTADLGLELFHSTTRFGFNLADHFSACLSPAHRDPLKRWSELGRETADEAIDVFRRAWLEQMGHVLRRRSGELEFLDLFTDKAPAQCFRTKEIDARVLLDLPSFRLLDVSLGGPHRTENYTVVFAPRAGHHSNIAERVALFLRDQGLSRMAIVEQKCADEIPLHVDGKRHYEDFNGQVDQYRQILTALKHRTGRPSHLVAVCQPGPLLMSTTILYPELARTFGSAGAPMHTEAEPGLLTDFARAVGPDYIDMLLPLFGRRVANDKPGSGREVYDGCLQVLGFYWLGMDQHLRNFRKLLSDLKAGNRESADRQKSFYGWYNYAHHFPTGFIRDTFKKIFVKNALIRGSLVIAGTRIGIGDYPGSVPVWALGGSRDEIAPPLQATGHMPLITAVPDRDKLTLICDAGHMGLFRSRRILENDYSRIAKFLLERSDRS